ncbi:HEAT repeat domain-containing protein [Streptomyces sp. NRRL WC-3742]|uniref:HEAT repeat domain-containing protein n=1 Tax=Streptomyces sp. NRRL WC-3742 TaxID=1463934 RepID=UPI00068EBDF1|nr:HEAT repeat domain-containing protein [Streptomyces sp. NRRL WC-3742]
MTAAESLDRLLLLLLDDPDSDVDESTDLAERLADCEDLSLVPALEAALDEALAAGNFHARDTVAGVLAGLTGPAALPVLLRASARDLGDDQDSLSAVLCDLFDEHPDAAREAADPLLSDPDARLRAVAVWTLGFASHAEDVDLLARTAADPSEEVRAATAGSLGSLAAAHPQALDLLITLLADPHPQVRIDALSALGWSHRTRALPAVQSLANDPDERVRRWAAISADRLGAQRGDDQ